ELMDQGGGGEDDVAAGADDPAAVAGDDVALGQEAGVAVVLVFLAFDVNVGAKAIEQALGGGIGIDVDEIDALEGGKALGAQVFGDQGAVNAFAHLRIGAEADDQEIAVGLGELEMVDVAGVDDVE